MLPHALARSSLATLALIALLPACADEVDPCELKASDACDIADEACVEHVRHVVTCMRGGDHGLPKIERLTLDEYIDGLPPVADPTPEEADLAARHTRAMQLLKLLPKTIEEADPTDIVAPYLIYDWERRVLTIVADGSDPEFELFSLVYTLVVADIDAEIGIDALFTEQTGTFDRTRALRTLIAGEAQFYADLAAWRNPDYRAAADDFAYGVGLNDTLGQFADPEVPWTAGMAFFHYVFGAWTTQGRYAEGGPEKVAAAYDVAIASTAYALAGGAEIEAAFSAIDTALPDPPEGFTYLSQDSYGPVMWHMAAVRRGDAVSDPNTIHELAHDWVGDRIIIAGETDGERVAVVWQRADSDGDIAETLVVASDGATTDQFAALFP